ncbi:hypothetical protein CAEBREN_07458 [Caenorhabditis brenneri]|uniref:JmjC domain-containing protein n=1 Tax=Caenorhabditis brenneri TaxID=135651 RepID=G0P1N1_CAEBE|nr:hypothetical protein CAEBREN_07458 [Caenorhabditis brenneri]
MKRAATNPLVKATKPTNGRQQPKRTNQDRRASPASTSAMDTSDGEETSGGPVHTRPRRTVKPTNRYSAGSQEPTKNGRSTAASDDRREADDEDVADANEPQDSNIPCSSGSLASSKRQESSSAVETKDEYQWHTLACFDSLFQQERSRFTDDQIKEIELLVEPVKLEGESQRIDFQEHDSVKIAANVIKKLFGIEVADEEQEVQETLQKKKKIKKLPKGELPKAPNPKVPYLLYTSGFEDGVVGQPGEEIVKRATNVYKHRDFRYVSDRIGASYAPTDFFVSKGFDPSTSSGIIEPIVVLDVEDPDLEAKAFAVDICLIKNCDKKINLDAFTLEKLISVGDSGEPTVFLRQRPQKSETNYKITGKLQNFIHENIEEKRLLREVLKNHEHVVKVARKEFANCTATFPIQRTQLLKMEKALREAQLDCPQATGREEYPLITFGSNIDVADAPEQMAAIRELPEFILPGKRLMSILKDKLYGINLVQAYVKGPGCRTVAHHENQGLVSVNINIGPGVCVWYSISMKHIAALEELLCRKSCFPFGTLIWPMEKDLQKAGIPYKKFLQHPGEMVFINTGTYHWVQSNGFATNISWNAMFDDATQLATAAIFSDQNAMHKYNTALPIEKLIWEAAKTQRNSGTDFSKVAKRMLTW